MIIKVGENEISVLRIHEEREYVGLNADKPVLRIELDGGLTQEQIDALCIENWIADGKTYRGYGQLLRHEAVFVGSDEQNTLDTVIRAIKSSTEEKAARVMFRALAQTDVITAADALDNALMFPLWIDNIGQRAEEGSYWRHADKLYRVNAGQGHTIQADWAPDQAASLFSLAADPAEEWPEWIQPTGAHNAYAVGDKVTHDGKRWISTADANTWAPGTYGWEEVK